MGKRILFLLFLLLLLIIYTVYSFEYNTILTNNNVISKQQNKTELLDTITNKYDELKKKFMNGFEEKPKEKVDVNPININLTKIDGNILMDGILKDKDQVLFVEDMLNIKKEGTYRYNPAVRLNDELLLKVSKLITPFKEFLLDGSKLVINGDDVSLSGKIKDASFKEELSSIISKNKLDIDLSSIKVEHKSKTEEIIDTIKEKNIHNLKEVAISEDVKKVTKKLSEIIKPNDVSIVKQIQSDINKVLADKKITFERRSTQITKDSYSSVKDVADILKANKNIKVEIGGHTDSRGAKSLNKRISQDRANSVRNALIDLGIEESRLTSVGYGEEFPIAEDDKDGLSEINRRVEIKVLGDK